jgi:hypothetical protein
MDEKFKNTLKTLNIIDQAVKKKEPLDENEE